MAMLLMIGIIYSILLAIHLSISPAHPGNNCLGIFTGILLRLVICTMVGI
jgi:hypothetical protein